MGTEGGGGVGDFYSLIKLVIGIETGTGIEGQGRRTGIGRAGQGQRDRDRGTEKQGE